MACILLIDDEDETREMLKQILRRVGHEVIEARDGNEGLQSFRATSVDLIITDIFMPDKEGLETIKDLRQESPKVKIIAMSGGGYSGNLRFLEMAKRLGAKGTIQKPFDVREILATVEEVLQMS